MESSGKSPIENEERPVYDRDKVVRRVLILEGGANVLVLLMKIGVAVMTGSLAVASDALHSVSDIANNVVALIITTYSSRPPDREHPYGHRKFETVAVFFLGAMLSVLALEIIMRVFREGPNQAVQSKYGLGVMLLVLAINIGVAWWQSRWAKRVRSDLLMADAKHTFSDVFATIAVLVGWQLSSRGYWWLDSLIAVIVAILVLYLAYGLFSRALPALVDKAALDPDSLYRVVGDVEGVQMVKRVRSRWIGHEISVDIVASVDAQLSALEAHEISNRIEQTVEQRFEAKDITVHIEPAQIP
ncbi:MAG: cation transporter [Myxococcales bacterium]|nr:MAG: cation transporter [Myxococcales bacterium]